MNIPSSILIQVRKASGPMNNPYFHHAENAMNMLNKINEDLYSYDCISVAINTLERVYKGFLQSAVDNVEEYQLRSANFLTRDHDIYGMMMEIKSSFPDVFPYQDRGEWRDTKTFLRSLRQEYTAARYTSYPTFEEFVAVRSYVQSQYELIADYIKEGNLTNDKDTDIPMDY